MAEFCHILGGSSLQLLEAETKEKKQGHNPNKAIFNCNSLSCLVKHYDFFSYLPHYEISNNVQHLPGTFTTHNVPEIEQQSVSLSKDFICEN